MSDGFVDFTNVVNSDILTFTTLKSGAGYVLGAYFSSHIWSTPQKWSKLAKKMPKWVLF